MVEEVDGNSGDRSGHEKMQFCLVGSRGFVLMSAGFGRIVINHWATKSLQLGTIRRK